MSERIFTLFGEEIFPEPQKSAGKGRGKKKEDDNNDSEAQPDAATPSALEVVAGNEMPVPVLSTEPAHQPEPEKPLAPPPALSGPASTPSGPAPTLSGEKSAHPHSVGGSNVEEDVPAGFTKETDIVLPVEELKEGETEEMPTEGTNEETEIELPEELAPTPSGEEAGNHADRENDTLHEVTKETDVTLPVEEIQEGEAEEIPTIGTNEETEIELPEEPARTLPGPAPTPSGEESARPNSVGGSKPEATGSNEEAEIPAPTPLWAVKKMPAYVVPQAPAPISVPEITGRKPEVAVKPEKPKKEPKPEKEKIVKAEIKETIATSADEAAAPPAEKKPRKKRVLSAAALPADWKAEDKYYTIGQVAELFKVKTSHIRFWTNEFKMKVRTTRKGDRLYNEEQVKEIRAIHHLVKERGFTIAGARAKMKEGKNRDVETVDLKHSLTELRNKLMIIKNQLR